MSVATYTKAGSKATTPAKLDKEVFGLTVTNHDLLKQAYTAYLANGRDNLAVTKTRGLVSGGGRKPWRQKGTGRARFGSSRNPIWRGGGIVFGPTGQENYSKKMPVSAKRQALRQALSLAAQANRIKVIETLDVTHGKVRTFAQLLAKLEAAGRILVVVDAKDNNHERVIKNIPNVEAVSPTYLSVYDIMNADTIIITKSSLDDIKNWLGKAGGTGK